MIKFRLLGAPRIEIAGEEVQLPYQKATALLAYLAVTERSHSRSALASLFWSEVDDSRAQNSLRNALFVIRRATAPHPLLVTERDLVSLSFIPPYATGQQNKVPFWLDVAAFKTAVRGEPTVDRLEEALELWRGPFLDGFSLTGAPTFDDWLTARRAQLDRLYQDGWLALSQAHEAAGQWGEAIETVQRLVTLDPLREAGHRQLIRLYLKQGHRSAALQQYEQCRLLLAEELGVAPDAQTQTLHAQALSEGGPIHLLGERSPTVARGQTAPNGMFVGRQRELSELNHHLQETAAARRGRLVLIEGEAGVGKTRLVHEWLAELRGATVLSGRCFEAEHSVPYHPWLDILRASLDHLGQEGIDLPPLWLAELARLIPELHIHRPDLPEAPALDSRLIRGRLAEAVRLWLEMLGRERPVCLFLDDLQWIDRASLALLEYVLRRSNGLPLLILGAQREAETDPDWQQAQVMLDREGLSHHLRLYRLSFPDVAAIARSMGVQSADPDAFMKRLFRETEGNPLFIVEVLRTLQRLDIDPAGEWPLPSTVGDVIRSRLDRLTPSTRQLLAVAAVIGRMFDYETLPAITGQAPDAVWLALEEAIAADLIQEQEGRYDFTHYKIQEVLYIDLSAPRRRHLHQRLAEILERSNAANLELYHGILAHHFTAAGEPARARDYALRAARRAVELYADEDALAEYERAAALSLAEGLSDDLPAEVAPEVVPFYTSGEEAGPMLSVLSLIHRQRGLIYQRVGRYDDAQEEFQAVLARAGRRGRADEAAAAHNALSFLSYLRGDYDEVARHAETAIEQAERAGNRRLKATGLKNLGIVAYRSGAYDRALDLYRQALTIYEAEGDPLGMGACYNNIGFVQDTQGEFDAAIASFQQALTLRKEQGQIEGQAVHLANIGRVYAHRGDVDRARQYLAQAFPLSEEIDATWVILKVHRTLSEVAILAGDWAIALDHARTAGQLAEVLGSQEDLGVVRHLLGEIAAGWPESGLGEAGRYFEDSIALLEEVGEQYELRRAQQRFEQFQQTAGPFDASLTAS